MTRRLWSRLLLLCFPLAFRDRLGRPMIQTLFDDARVRSGRVSPWRMATLSFDVAAAGLRERLQQHRARRAHGREAPVHWRTEGLGRELGQAWRSLVRRRGLALTVFLTLTLGLAVNTAVFAIVNAVLVRELPYRDPGRLGFMWTKLDWIGVPRAWVAGPHIMQLRREATTIDAIVPIRTPNAQLTGAGAPRQIRAGRSDTSLFDVLGVRPALGRTFVREDAPRNVAVLSDALWRQQFGADPAVVGRHVEIDGDSTEVIGVLPADFHFLVHASLGDPTAADLWQPVDWDLAKMSDGQFAFAALVRVKPGRSMAQAQAELDAIGAGLDRTRYQSHGFGWRLVGVQDDLMKNARPALVLIVVAAAGVLLVVCANVAGLMLVRNADRQREFAVRTALGASRGQVIRLVVLECVGLSLAAGLAGLALASLAVRAIVSSGTLPVPRLTDISIDWRVVGGTVAVSCLTGLVFGLLPALRTTRPDSGVLKDASRGSSRHTGRLRAWLIAAELAIAVVLVAGAVLLVRSYAAVRGVDPGFDPRGVLVATITLDSSRYAQEAQAVSLHERLNAALAAVPGVTHVGAATSRPLAGDTDQSAVRLADGHMMAGRTDGSLLADIMRATPGYFGAMGIPLVSGRDFTWQDRATSQPVAIVDERFARAAWGDGSAIGRAVTVDAGKPLTVVGVVRHARQYRIDQDDREQLYRPYAQDTTIGITLAIRTNGDPDSLVQPLRRIVGDLDPRQPVARVETMAAVVDDALVLRRLQLQILGAFAVGTLLLAAIGIYGVLSSAVSDRTREIGIRMALGADARSVRRLVLRQTLALTAAGLGVGLVVTIGTARLFSHFLFGVSARDPESLLITGALVVAAAILASYAPLRRATSIDPASSLRAQ